MPGPEWTTIHRIYVWVVFQHMTAERRVGVKVKVYHNGDDVFIAWKPDIWSNNLTPGRNHFLVISRMF